MIIDDKQAYQQIIAQNQRLLQNLNNNRHRPAEIRQLVGEITAHHIADSTEIRLPFYTDFGRNIKIGRHVFINAGVTFVDSGGITVADDVLIGPGSFLISVNHWLEPAHRHQLQLAPVLIKKNAWLGAASIILPGVTVGENAVVGAGAVVTKDVPANTVAVGNPARVIKKLADKAK